MSGINLAYEPRTGKIFVNNGEEKRDVTNQFIQILLHRFPLNTSQSVSVDGFDTCKVIVASSESEVRIDGNLVYNFVSSNDSEFLEFDRKEEPGVLCGPCPNWDELVLENQPENVVDMDAIVESIENDLRSGVRETTQEEIDCINVGLEE